jgi:hypothetical protein
MNSPDPSLQNIAPQAAIEKAPVAKDPLAQLQDIYLPAEIGLWPPAWGWWVLLGAVIASISLLVFLIKRKKSRNFYRALAITELNTIHTKYDESQSSEYLQALSILLRRTALSGFGAHFNASLKGNKWLEWLDAQCPKTNQQFSQGIGTVLLIGPYQKAPEFVRDELHQLSLLWVSEHRNQWQQSKKTKVEREAIDHV